jgi:hypothetical protein
MLSKLCKYNTKHSDPLLTESKVFQQNLADSFVLQLVERYLASFPERQLGLVPVQARLVQIGQA